MCSAPVAPLKTQHHRKGGGGGPPKPIPPPPKKAPAALYPPRQDGHGGPRETGQGERETQREVTGQGRPRSPTMVQSAEGGTVVKQDKSSGGSGDTTETRSGPQRVRMCDGEEANGRRHRQTNQRHGAVPTPQQKEPRAEVGAVKGLREEESAIDVCPMTNAVASPPSHSLRSGAGLRSAARLRMGHADEYAMGRTGDGYMVETCSPKPPPMRSLSLGCLPVTIVLGWKSKAQRPIQSAELEPCDRTLSGGPPGHWGTGLKRQSIVGDNGPLRMGHMGLCSDRWGLRWVCLEHPSTTTVRHAPCASGEGLCSSSGHNFFLLSTAFENPSQGPPTANGQRPPTANRHQPPIANHQPQPTATNRHQPPSANRHQPRTPSTNRHQPPTANHQSPSTMFEHMSYMQSSRKPAVLEHFFLSP